MYKSMQRYETRVQELLHFLALNLLGSDIPLVEACVVCHIRQCIATWRTTRGKLNISFRQSDQYHPHLQFICTWFSYTYKNAFCRNIYITYQDRNQNNNSPDLLRFKVRIRPTFTKGSRFCSVLMRNAVNRTEMKRIKHSQFFMSIACM